MIRSSRCQPWRRDQPGSAGDRRHPAGEATPCGGTRSWLAVLEGLVPALDLALGLGMIRRTADVGHLPVVEPDGKVVGYVAGAVIAEQPGLVADVGLVAA